MLRRFLPILLLALVVGLPGTEAHGKRKAKKNEGMMMPDLKQVLGHAYEIPPELSSRSGAGDILQVKDGRVEVFKSGCVAGEPKESDVTSISMQSQLSGGVRMNLGIGSVRGAASSSLALNFQSPHIYSYELADFTITPECEALLKAKAGVISVAGLVVVREVMMAKINGCKKLDTSVDAQVAGRGGSASSGSSCELISEAPVVIGYRTQPVTEMLPSLAATPVPPVAPPPQTPPTRAPARASRPIPSAEASVPTPAAGRSSDGFTNSIGMKFVRIEAGSFKMGCTAEQGSDCEDNEKSAHNATLTRSFYMQTTEVTQGQWRAVMGSNPSHFSGCNDCPVEQVNWKDAVRYAKKLSAKEGLRGGSVYRLPTEAEWEYAARAGQGTKYAGSNDADAVAWHRDNSGSKTHPVGQKSPNAWGLYDMSGNVWEWTADWYGDYSSGGTTNPEGASSGAVRVSRGGSWIFYPRVARVAYRLRVTPGNRRNNLGLRLLRTIP